MRAGFLKVLERKINNRRSLTKDGFLEANPYVNTSTVIDWLVRLFKTRINGVKNFSDFDHASGGKIKAFLTDGDTFYVNLFQSGTFIDIRTKENESDTPYSNAIRSVYNSLFRANHKHDEMLILYIQLRAFIERTFGRKLAKDTSLQTYEQWLAIDKILEVEHEITGEWIDSLSVDIIRSEKAKFLSPKTNWPLGKIAVLQYGYRDRHKAAKNYIAQLRKTPKKPVFDYVDTAVKNADLIHFTREISLQKNLSKRLGIKEFLLFIDHLRYPIAQDHAFFFIEGLGDYVRVVQDICSPLRRRTSPEFLLIIALRNYFGFVDRTLIGLENYIISANGVEEEAQQFYDDWTGSEIQKSFNKIMAAVIGSPSLSALKYLVPFFDWLNSYSKLHLVHRVTHSQRDLIDLLNSIFQDRLDSDSKSHHYLADQLLLGKINQEALKKHVSALQANPGDASFLDKVYNNYITHLESGYFRWYAEGNVDKIEAINQAYYFSQVLCAYRNGDVKWLRLYEKHRNYHQGWLPLSSNIVAHQRETYLLTAGIGMAHFRYFQKTGSMASTVLFSVIELILRQLRSAESRTSIDYETPLWFAGATLAKFAAEDLDRFMEIICKHIDSIKRFIRIVYEVLRNSEVTNLFLATRTNIGERIRREFFLVESNKVDVDLLRDFNYYDKMKLYILEKISDP